MKTFKNIAIVVITIMTLTAIQSKAQATPEGTIHHNTFYPAESKNPLVQKCASLAGENAIYLKEFVISFPKTEKNNLSSYKEALVLRKDNLYRFNFINKVTVRIYDIDGNLLLISEPKTKESNPIDFFCRKTTQYIIIISHENKNGGEVIGTMSFIST